MDTAVDMIVEQLNRLGASDVPGAVIRLAKADHVIWKKKLADLFVGRARLVADELADHHSCRLGKWYYGDASARLRDHPAFERLEGPHARVHAHGIEATRLYNTGDTAAALAEMAKVEIASVEVVACLDELIAVSGK